MSDYLVAVVCERCAHEHLFEPDNMPGGLDHCEYCEMCSAPLPDTNAYKIEKYESLRHQLQTAREVIEAVHRCKNERCGVCSGIVYRWLEDNPR